MKLGLRHKIFMALFLSSLVIVICIPVIGQYYFSRSFEDYTGKVEQERLLELSEALILEYRKSGSWEPLVQEWSEFLSRAAGSRHPPGHGTRGRPMPPSPPLLPPLPPHFPPPPPPMGIHSPKTEPPPFGKPPSPPPGLPPHFDSFGERLALFDSEKRLLTESENSSIGDYRLQPIMVDRQTVGWVGLRRHEGPRHQLDAEFIRRQSQMLLMIGGVVLIQAVIVTLALSRHLLAPLRELTEGTRALSLRRFETRIDIRSRDEIGQLAEDFNNMAQALERYELMRRQWIADIAHELRTPIAILRGEIEAMQDGVREITREALDSLHFEVMHVSRIVQDLHDLSLIESEASWMQKTALDPLEVLEETLKCFRTRFESSAIRVEVMARGDGSEPSGNGARILADGDRLKQLFSNLLDNTLKYVQAPGELKISQERSSGFLLLHFDDSGPGVPEEALERLFDRLYRVDKARSRVQGGSGLGLAICKSIVESFGGRIEAARSSFGGLRINIVFPVIAD